MTPLALSSVALAALVQEVLPPTAKGGEKVVVGTIDNNGAQVVASFTFKAGWWKAGRWEVQAAAQHRWSGDDSVGTKILLRW